MQHGVHSTQAARLIQTLLTTRMPTRDNDEEDNKADESDADAEIPALAYRPDDMRALLMRSQAVDTQDGPSQKRMRVRKKRHTKPARAPEIAYRKMKQSATV